MPTLNEVVLSEIWLALVVVYVVTLTVYLQPADAYAPHARAAALGMIRHLVYQGVALGRQGVSAV
jgi:hypothetical protein